MRGFSRGASSCVPSRCCAPFPPTRASRSSAPALLCLGRVSASCHCHPPRGPAPFYEEDEPERGRVTSLTAWGKKLWALVNERELTDGDSVGFAGTAAPSASVAP